MGEVVKSVIPKLVSDPEIELVLKLLLETLMFVSWTKKSKVFVSFPIIRVTFEFETTHYETESDAVTDGASYSEFIFKI